MLLSVYSRAAVGDKCVRVTRREESGLAPDPTYQFHLMPPDAGERETSFFITHAPGISAWVYASRVLCVCGGLWHLMSRGLSNKIISFSSLFGTGIGFILIFFKIMIYARN